MSTLVGNLVSRAFNFFHHSVNKKMSCIHYCLGMANFCLKSRRKINSHKMEGFGLMSPLYCTDHYFCKAAIFLENAIT